MYLLDSDNVYALKLRYRLGKLDYECLYKGLGSSRLRIRMVYAKLLGKSLTEECLSVVKDASKIVDQDDSTLPYRALESLILPFVQYHKEITDQSHLLEPYLKICDVVVKHEMKFLVHGILSSIFYFLYFSNAEIRNNFLVNKSLFNKIIIFLKVCVRYKVRFEGSTQAADYAPVQEFAFLVLWTCIWLARTKYQKEAIRNVQNDIRECIYERSCLAYHASVRKAAVSVSIELMECLGCDNHTALTKALNPSSVLTLDNSMLKLMHALVTEEPNMDKNGTLTPFHWTVYLMNALHNCPEVMDTREEAMKLLIKYLETDIKNEIMVFTIRAIEDRIGCLEIHLQTLAVILDSFTLKEGKEVEVPKLNSAELSKIRNLVLTLDRRSRYISSMVMASISRLICAFLRAGDIKSNTICYVMDFLKRRGGSNHEYNSASVYKAILDYENYDRQCDNTSSTLTYLNEIRSNVNLFWLCISKLSLTKDIEFQIFTKSFLHAAEQVHDGKAESNGAMLVAFYEFLEYNHSEVSSNEFILCDYETALRSSISKAPLNFELCTNKGEIGINVRMAALLILWMELSKLTTSDDCNRSHVRLFDSIDEVIHHIVLFLLDGLSPVNTLAEWILTSYVMRSSVTTVSDSICYLYYNSMQKRLVLPFTYGVEEGFLDDEHKMIINRNKKEIIWLSKCEDKSKSRSFRTVTPYFFNDSNNVDNVNNVIEDYVLNCTSRNFHIVLLLNVDRNARALQCLNAITLNKNYEDVRHKLRLVLFEYAELIGEPNLIIKRNYHRWIAAYLFLFTLTKVMNVLDPEKRLNKLKKTIWSHRTKFSTELKRKLELYFSNEEKEGEVLQNYF